MLLMFEYTQFGIGASGNKTAIGLFGAITNGEALSLLAEDSDGFTYSGKIGEDTALLFIDTKAQAQHT